MDWLPHDRPAHQGIRQDVGDYDSRRWSLRFKPNRSATRRDGKRVVPLALAGTSAGAIVATLFWAGLRPFEIRDRFLELARTNKLTSLIGPFEPTDNPFTFKSFARLTRQIMAFLGRVSPESRPSVRFGKWFSQIRLLTDARWLLKQIEPHAKNRGIFAGEHLEKFIDDLLREGISRQDPDAILPDRLLTFGDVADLAEKSEKLYFPPLFLAATNLNNLDVELISSMDLKYQNVPISRAVRASAGFPVFFRPVDIEGLSQPAWFVDGGMISNFPAWAFSDTFRVAMVKHKAYVGIGYRPWTHIGLRLVEPQHEGASGEDIYPLYEFETLREPQTFFSSMAKIVTGQARNILEDKISEKFARSIIIRQPINETGGPENILDVAAISRRRIKLMYEKGRKFAENVMAGYRFDLPGHDAANGVRPYIEELLERLVEKAGLIFGIDNNADLKFRSNIFLPQQEKLILTYSHNMEGASDVDMAFDAPTHGLTGFCYTLRRPFVCNLGLIASAVEEDDRKRLFGMSAAQHDKVDPSRTWLASMPIFDPKDLTNQVNPMAEVPWPGAHYVNLDISTDGPVLGVLNLDAGFDYTAVGLNEDPEKGAADLRIEAVMDIMTVTSRQIAQILDTCFAAKSEE